MRQVDRSEAEVSKFQKQLEESRNAGMGSRDQAQKVNTQLTVSALPDAYARPAHTGGPDVRRTKML